MANVKDLLVNDFCNEVNVSAHLDSNISEVSQKMEKIRFSTSPLLKVISLQGS
jgi:hypothetical protein